MHYSFRSQAVVLVAVSWVCACAFVVVHAQESTPVVLKLIAEKKFAEAEQWIDNQLVLQPESLDLLALHAKFGMVVAQAERNSDRGAILIKNKLSQLIDAPTLTALHSLVAAQALDELLRIEQSAGAVSPTDDLTRKLLVRLRSLFLNEPSPAYESILRTNVDRLVWSDRFEDAKTLLDEEMRALKSIVFSSATCYRSRLASIAMIASQSMVRVFPEYIDQLIEQISIALLAAAEPSPAEFETFLRFERATILALAMNSTNKAQPQLTKMMSGFERFRMSLSEESQDNFKRMAGLLTRAVKKSEEAMRVIGSDGKGIRFARILDFRTQSDRRASTEIGALAKDRYAVVFFWSANSGENLRQLRLLHRWYQNCDTTRVQVVAATLLNNYRWSEPLQLGVVAKSGTVSQAEEIKMLESIQEKFGLCFPLAIVESVALQIPKTGLIVIAPSGTIVDALQMEPQSLRTIDSILRR